MEGRKLLQYIIDISDVVLAKKQEATEYLAKLEEAAQQSTQKESISDEFPATGDLQDILGDCPAGTNWASRPEYQSREA